MQDQVRKAALRALRRLDHAVGRTASIRVLVDVRTPMNLAVLRPVWQRLRSDPRVTLAFAAEDEPGVSAALALDGVDDALLRRDAAAWARWDLVMTADAWNHTTLHRCRRSVNFFHGVAGKYDLDNPRALEAADLRRFDRIAFINERRMTRYLDAGLVEPDQAVLVGYPKGDDLVNGAWPAAGVRRSLGLSPSAPTLLYAPTFSPASSLHLAGAAIIGALLDTGSNVLVKLHDRSAVPHPKHTAGIDWPATLERFAANPRFALARSADAGPFLSASDLLVTDHSSVGFEFALLDRPIVVYHSPGLREAARIDAAQWDLLRSMADVVDAADRLPAVVASALANPSRLHEQRARAHELFAFAGSATERAVAAVYELLEVEPPALAQNGADASGLECART